MGAIEEITIHQGIDPRGAVLIGGGGAAGLNSVAIAKRLGCLGLVIPEVGAALSAAGAMMSDLHADYRSMFFTITDRFDFKGANAVLRKLDERCRAFIRGPGKGAVESATEFYVEARYKHQVWEIDLGLPINRFRSKKDVERARAAFDEVHEEVFAFRDPSSEVEFVGWRAVARCKLRKGHLGRLVRETIHETTLPKRRKAYFAGKGLVNARVAAFDSMKPGEAMRGPSIIESPFTTVVIDPGAKAERTRSGSLFITLQE